MTIGKDIDWQMLDDVEKFIRNLNYDEWVSISNMMKKRREIINKDKINNFSKGDHVEFNSKGKTIKGYITKVKIKRISVKTDEGKWDVPATLLEFSK